MRWKQVSCLNCRLTNSCFHVVVFLSDEIFLFVFFGGKKIKCPPPGCSDPKYFVLGSCLPRARPRLFFFVSLEIFFWVLFLQHLFFSEWLLYFFGIKKFLLVCTNRELQVRSITPSSFLFWIQQVSQFLCMCLRCTTKVP